MSIVIYGDLERTRALLASWVSRELAQTITRETRSLAVDGLKIILEDSDTKHDCSMSVIYHTDGSCECSNSFLKRTVPANLLIPQMLRMHKKMTVSLSKKLSDKLATKYVESLNQNRQVVNTNIESYWSTLVEEREVRKNSEDTIFKLLMLLGTILGFAVSINPLIAISFAVLGYIAAFVIICANQKPDSTRYREDLPIEIKTTLQELHDQVGIPTRPKPLEYITISDLPLDLFTIDGLYCDELKEQL